ncbi:GtrA family protein [Thiobacillus sp.]|uniref:GtrA family protein n=1 Tax=Thiobacillus sp. TaxID=924 RepID=UPI00286D8BE6|nr:GtrA family protein [Thiobacillus sp.]
MKSEFVRYIGVGGVAFIADFGLLAVLTLAGLHYLPAALLAFLLGTWVNYRLSIRWVFTYRAIDTRGAEFGLFLLVGVITLGVSLGLMALLVERLSMHVLLAKCVVTAFTLVSNFAGRRALLFTRWGRFSMVSSAR